MRRYRVVALMVLLGFAATAASYARDKDKETVGRMLTGKVLDRHDNSRRNWYGWNWHIHLERVSVHYWSIHFHR